MSGPTEDPAFRLEIALSEEFFDQLCGLRLRDVEVLSEEARPDFDPETYPVPVRFEGQEYAVDLHVSVTRLKPYVPPPPTEDVELPPMPDPDQLSIPGTVPTPPTRSTP